MSTFRIPIFPLGTTVFPSQLLPLHIFEERYRTLMADLVALESDQRFGIVLIERGFEVGGGETRFDVATRVELVQAEELDDGRWAIAVAGIDRLEIVRWLDDDPYPQAEVRLLERVRNGGDVAGAERLLGDVLQLVSELNGHPPPSLPQLASEPGVRLDQLSALAPLNSFDRQEILAATSTSAQVDLLCEALEGRRDIFRAQLGR